MKVIFLQDVTNIARAGDVKEVANGFARNYLIPHKLATPASVSAEATAEVQKKIRLSQAAREEARLRELADQIQGKEIVIRAKVGAKDKLFGSVTGADIATELQRVVGTEIDKRKIELAEPIKMVGTYEIEVKLAKDISPKIKVTVEGETVAEVAEEKTEEKPKPEKPEKPKKKKAEKEAEAGQKVEEANAEAVEKPAPKRKKAENKPEAEAEPKAEAAEKREKPAPKRKKAKETETKTEESHS